MDVDELIRLNVIQLMREQGLTQAELVRRIVRCGHVFDTATMSRVLKVKGGLPVRGHLEKFADGLAVPADRLLKRITPPVDCAPGPSEGEGDNGEDVTVSEHCGQEPPVPHARGEA